MKRRHTAPLPQAAGAEKFRGQMGHASRYETFVKAVRREEETRYSIIFFLSPGADTVRECLPSCQSPGYRAQYP